MASFDSNFPDFDDLSKNAQKAAREMANLNTETANLNENLGTTTENLLRQHNSLKAQTELVKESIGFDKVKQALILKSVDSQVEASALQSAAAAAQKYANDLLADSLTSAGKQLEIDAKKAQLEYKLAELGAARVATSRSLTDSEKSQLLAMQDMAQAAVSALEEQKKKIDLAQEAAKEAQKASNEMDKQVQSIDDAIQKTSLLKIADENRVKNAESLVASQKRQNKLISEAQGKTDTLTNGLFGWMDKFLSSIPGGGILNKALGVDGIRDKFGKASTDIFTKLAEGGMTGKQAFKDLGKEGVSAFGNIGKAMFSNPWTLLLVVIVGAIARFMELDKAGEKFRQKTGLVSNQMRSIEKIAREVNVQLKYIGVGIDEAYNAAASLVDTFVSSFSVTKDLTVQIAQMSANLGVAEEDSAKVYQTFLGLGNTTKEVAMGTMVIGANLSHMAGVPIATVFKDMANASNDTIAFLGKSPMMLLRTTIEARRLGTTLESLTKSARGMLNFQESINAEMEASVLTGVNLNFQESRRLAFEGKTAKSREAAMRQLSKLGDFSNMNFLQKEAAAKAAEMEVGEIIKMQAQEKILNAVKQSGSKEDKRLLEEYRTSLVDLDAERFQSDLDKGNAFLQVRHRQSEITNMTKQLEAIWTDISDALLSIAQVLMPIIGVLVNIIAVAFKFVSGIIKGMLSPINKILQAFGMDGISGSLEKIQPYFDKMGEWAEKFGELVGESVTSIRLIAKVLPTIARASGNIVQSISRLPKVFQLVLSPVRVMFELIDKGATKVEGLLKNFGGIIPLITDSANGLAQSISKLPKILQTVLYPVKTLFTWIAKGSLQLEIWMESIGTKFSRIGSKIGKFFSPIKNAITYVAELFGLVGKSTGLFSKLVSPFVGIFKFVGKFIGSIFGFIGKYVIIITIIQGLLLWFPKLMTTWGDSTKSFFGKVVESVASLGTSLAEVIIAPLDLFKSGLAAKVVQGIVDIGSDIMAAIIQPFYDAGSAIIDIFTDTTASLPKRLMNACTAIPKFLIDMFLYPIDIIASMFPKKIQAGITSVVDWIKDHLLAPFRWVYDKVLSFLGGKSPSKLGMAIVAGIESIGSMIFDFLLSPFKNAYTNIITIFKNLGPSILGGLKTIGSGIVDLITWPFRTAWKMINALFSLNGSTILDTVKGIADGIFTAIGDTGDAIVDIVKSAISSISNVASNLFSTLTQPFKLAGKVISSVFTYVTALIEKNIGGINAIIGRIVGFVKNTAQKILSTLSFPFKVIQKVVTTAFSLIKDVVGRDVDKISSNIKGIITTVGNVKNQIFSGLTAPFRSISKVVSSTFSDIKVTISSYIDKTVSVFGKVIKAVKNFPEVVGSTISKVVQSIWTGVTSVLKKLPTVIRSSILGIAHFIVDIPNSVKNVSKKIFDVLTWPFRMGWKVVTSGFSSAIVGIREHVSKISSIIGRIIGTVKNVASKVVDVLTNPFKTVKSILSILLGNGIKSSLIGLVETVKSVSSSVVNFLYNGVKNGVKSMGSILSKGSDILIAFGKNAISFVTSPFEKAWEVVSRLFSGGASKFIGSIYDTVRTGISSTIDAVKDIPSKVFNVVTNPFKKAYGWVSGLFSGNGEGGILSGLLDSVKGVGATVFSAISDPFKSAIDFVKSIGKDGMDSLGKGIITGIKAFNGVVIDMLTSPFKAAIDIVKSLPIIGKLFSSAGNAVAKAIGDKTADIEAQVNSIVEIKNLDELRTSIDALSTAISKLNTLSFTPSPTTSTTPPVADSKDVVAAIEKLIEKLTNGEIAVNLDGRKVSSGLTAYS